MQAQKVTPPPQNDFLAQDSASIASNLATLNKNITDLTESFARKHDELSTKLDSRFAEYDTIIHSTSTLVKANANELNALKAIVDTQAQTIQDLKNLVISNDKKNSTAITEVLTLANSIEAHQRRWSVRIFGLPAPTTAIETSDQSKHVVLDFIKDNLMIDDVTMDDLDCSHRVGEIKDHCQPMLVRCYSRDLVQTLLHSKSNLKGTEIMLHEDSTFLNRQLRLKLKADPRVENSWMYNGAVWAKMVSNGKIAKFALDDDMYEKIGKESAKIFNRPNNKRPNQNRPNQRPTTPKTHLNNTAHQSPRHPAPQPNYTSFYSPPPRYHPSFSNYSGIATKSFPTYNGAATSV
jgi:hypothetical protein